MIFGSFLEASRFFWVSTLLLITVSIWFATHAWLCWCWVLALAEKGPSARMMRTRIGMIGMKTKKMKRWERHTCHNRCTHPLGCHIRWDAEWCIRDGGWSHARSDGYFHGATPKNYDVQSVSKAARVSTIQHIPVFPWPLRLASFQTCIFHPVYICIKIHRHIYGHYFVTYEILYIGIILSESCRHSNVALNFASY